MSLRKIFLILLIIITYINYISYSQNTNAGKIEGRIIAAGSGESMISASVAILKAIDSTAVTGDKTDKSGKFAINDIPYGIYLLKVSYLGYKTAYSRNIMIDKNNTHINMGDISLQQTAIDMSEIEVTGKRDYIEFSQGKKIISVEQGIVNSGGNALDVMKTIPSVDVDMDGNVSLRGSGSVKILIDGKPSTLVGNLSSVLEQIPAGMIDKIEIITNPSAKYDPEGLSGIINVILKKDKNFGLNGQIGANAGTSDKYNSAVNVNYNTGFLNLFAGYDFRGDIRNMNGSSFRQSIFTDSSNFLDQNNTMRRKSLFHNVRGGFDLNFSRSDRISASGSARLGSSGNDEVTNYSYLNNLRILDSYSTGDYFESSPRNNYDASLSYIHLFESKDNKLTADFFYSSMDDDEASDLAMNFFNPDMTLRTDTVYKQYSDNYEKFTTVTAQADYENKFESGIKVEAGWKSFFRKTDDDYKFKLYDMQTSLWLNDINKSNRFIYEEYVHALYLTGSYNWNLFSLQAGLRMEYTQTNGNQLTQNSQFEKEYLDLFPTFNLSYKLTQTQDLQFNFSRRINRPNDHQLNPFVDYGDPQNIRYGNPELDPEYIGSYEIGYINNFKVLTLNSSVFYRQNDNAVTRFARLDTSGVMAMTFLNLANQKSLGFELGISADFAKWWRFNADFSYYYSKLESNRNIGNATNEDYLWNAKFNSNFFISSDLSFQISGFYNAPNVTIQGRRYEFYSVDVGTKYDLFDKKLSLTLRWSDIFDTMKFRVYGSGSGFEVSRSFKRETSIIMLGFTYKINDGLKQRERRKQSDENGGGDNFDF
ncbi:MAG: hypothetical protein QG635_441 [Bacteroidota bacterium]|nr:hypothetical protein [Bacteroidota bacterium]